jgi:hypothetical protein
VRVERLPSDVDGHVRSMLLLPQQVAEVSDGGDVAPDREAVVLEGTGLVQVFPLDEVV